MNKRMRMMILVRYHLACNNPPGHNRSLLLLWTSGTPLSTQVIRCPSTASRDKEGTAPPGPRTSSGAQPRSRSPSWRWTRSLKQVQMMTVIMYLDSSTFRATGQRLYMVHMLLLPFLPITALIVQVSCDWWRAAVLTSDWSRTAAPW